MIELIQLLIENKLWIILLIFIEEIMFLFDFGLSILTGFICAIIFITIIIIYESKDENRIEEDDETEKILFQCFLIVFRQFFYFLIIKLLIELIQLLIDIIHEYKFELF